ncbi:MAG TPA: RDD family protein [Verrucomicrobiae bacterium]|jgi:uncharacterized RDD family membrane protein YckC|nr:RDD family protein [Verrucomicrobiae bacterium]
MNWYYVDAGKQAGPVDDAGLEALAAGGKVTNETLVWREGMATWQAYGQVRPGGLRISSGAVVEGIGEEEAICAECGQMFPISDTIKIGEARVCANCKPIFVQKMREGVNVRVEGRLNYAGFWVRFAAVFLDGLILKAVNMAILLAFGFGFAAALGGSRMSSQVSPLYFALLGVQILIAVLYEVIMIGKYGATLGKMACKIRVVTPDGAPVSYGTAVARYFSKIVSSLICAIGYIMAGFDDEKRALHDRMCSTRVIYN